MSDLDVAFAQAAEARGAIADVIDRVRSGEWTLTQAFEAGDQDPLMGRCFAVKVIEVVPDIGKVRARRTMDEVGVADDAWLRDVAAAQRKQIIAALAADPA